MFSNLSNIGETLLRRSSAFHIIICQISQDSLNQKLSQLILDHVYASYSRRVSNHVEFEFRVRVRVSSKFSNFMWMKTVELPN